MTKEQKEFIANNEWRKLLLSFEPGEYHIAVKTIGELKSIRSIASDLSTDRSIETRYSINADKDMMLLRITVSEK